MELHAVRKRQRPERQSGGILGRQAVDGGRRMSRRVGPVEHVADRRQRGIEQIDREGLWQTDQPGNPLHGAEAGERTATVWHGEEHHAARFLEWLVARQSVDQAAGGCGQSLRVEGTFEQTSMEGLAGLGDARAGEQSAHRVTDQHHLPQFAIVALGPGESACGAHFLAEYHAAVQPGISGRIAVDPDLVVRPEPRVGCELVDHVLECIRA